MMKAKGVVAVAVELASLEEMMDSTSLMQISMLSGFRSTDLNFQIVIFEVEGPS